MGWVAYQCYESTAPPMGADIQNGVPLPAFGRSYQYDDIGNRIRYSAVGAGVNWTEHWLYNQLNQLTEKEHSRWVSILGITLTEAEVKINDQAVQRILTSLAQNGFSLFYGSMDAGKDRLPSEPVWQRIHTEVTGAETGEPETPTSHLTRHAYVAPTPETRHFDADGNLISDSRWHYTWDARNRLVQMQTRSAAAEAGVPPQRLSFAYDSYGRRISKTVEVEDPDSMSYIPSSIFYYIYDGWNLIAQLKAEGNGSPQLYRTYTHGLDIAQSTSQSAGGVGALLAVHWEPDAESAYPYYDGNGNVMGLISSGTGELVARYSYDAFGKTVIQEGPRATENPFRFSTKYSDDETDLLYYGFRYYNPGTGRWLNRDPIEEEGGLNLYGFVGNDGANRIDILGLSSRYREMPVKVVYTLRRELTLRDGFAAGSAVNKFRKAIKDVADADGLISFISGANDVANSLSGFMDSVDLILNADDLSKWPIVHSSVRAFVSDIDVSCGISFNISVLEPSIAASEVTLRGGKGYVLAVNMQLTAYITWISSDQVDEFGYRTLSDGSVSLSEELSGVSPRTVQELRPGITREFGGRPRAWEKAMRENSKTGTTMFKESLEWSARLPNVLESYKP